ncbi:serine/threonine protein kinases [Leptospira ryugenii]|uniref:Serine/threonine protein kinases n=1 Tax=Leptospira ryugenii TaxID=1917863 RepID=A0A2P2E497_9LEPT|nr:cyclic nucleotide-binding domain-containing protein [Leptospira ryugenii]GBF51710.1 serine/threonine protein kinases [Leptospira ryugenii]
MIAIGELIEILRTVDLFSEIPHDSILELASALKEDHFRKDEVILHKGDPGTCMYIIYHGRVYVHFDDQKVAEIGARQTFGEFSLLNSEPRNASITALEDSHLLRLDQEDFYAIMGNSTEFMRGVVRILILRLAEQNKELIDTLKRREVELTQKVEEQTKDLISAIMEIKSQNDSLEQYNQEIMEQKKEIEKKNHDITESIRYARTIQQSILPSRELISWALPDSFILFRPRDVVSGDFYWFTSKSILLEGKEETLVVIAAADCTGHGVPGAFMSMIGNSLLNDIVNARGVHDPDEILNLLHRGVRYSLNQEMTESRDGMDIALCSLYLERRELYYAGAMNSLYFVQNGELQELKADRRSIGGTQKEGQRIFTKHTIDVNQDTCFYMTTDGYLDQFSGLDHKKFMSKRFKDLIIDNHKNPMSEQKEVFEATMKDWMNGCDQIDDILVIGVHIPSLK